MGPTVKTLVWQTKEFIFYPEVFRVHLKDLEHGRDMAIFMVENCKSWHALQDLLGEGQPVGRFLQWCPEDAMSSLTRHGVGGSKS